jgi:hypothetical protein
MVSLVLQMVLLRVLAVSCPLDAVMIDVHTLQTLVSVSPFQDYNYHEDGLLTLGLLYGIKYRIRPHILRYIQMYRRFGRHGPACCSTEWLLI